MTERLLSSLDPDSLDVTPTSEVKAALIRSWADISSKLPEGILNTEREYFVRQYFRAQVKYHFGQETRARRIIRGLESNPSFKFREFEENNEQLFAAIDVSVRGSTRRIDDRNRPIKPSFTLNTD